MNTAPGDLCRTGDRPDLSRRSFLRTAALAGGGLVGATLAACSPGASAWSYAPLGPTAGTTSSAASPVISPTPEPSATMDRSSAAGASREPTSTGEHDQAAEAVVKRFPEKTDRMGNEPLEPRLEGEWKVFDLDCSAFEWQIDAQKPPVQAVGYNGTWPGPILRVTEGDKVRAIVTNHLDETTGVHFHGQAVPNPMDGVPFLTQPPIGPGESFTYEFVAKPAGSHMYHSHHNATDQVGRGLLGAFLVEPRDPAQRYDRTHGASQEIVWISNDSLGGFTINGKGFPATVPIVAKLGERIVIRFMNEGVMMHPWHLHGMPMHVVARDGYPLGSAAFACDTLGVNPGERWDAVIDCQNPGVWAFHCHILPHAEGGEGMFGMVSALIIE
jgi:FtsP/CotA-like multicopper oxidase with cupredoxin domain